MRILHLQKRLVHVALALNLYSFASALVGVFIPLLILQGGGRLWEVPAFYLLYAVCKLCVNYPAALLIRRRGAHVGLALAFVAGFLQLLAIFAFVATHSRMLLPVAGLSLALTNAFLWNSQHLFVSKVMEGASKSSSIATITMIGQFSGVLAPMLGGFIGAYFGAGLLLAVALGVCLAALMVALTMEAAPAGVDTPAIVYNLSGAPFRDIVANYCFNIETAVGVMVWPIYLAVAIAGYRSIGLMAAAAAVASLAVTWLAGRRGDRAQDRSVLVEGVVVSSLIDVIRIAVSGQFWIAAVTAGYKASLAYFQNAWISVYYHHAKHRGLQYIMSMEIACDLAYVTLWGVLLAVLLSSSGSRPFFVAAFAIAAISGWGCLLISRQGEFRGNTST